MKNNWAARLVVLVAVMTLITASLVSGTFAKYTTEVSGTDNVIVAKWKADFEGVGTTTAGAVTLDLFDTTAADGVTAGTIAPGTSGSFSADYDTSGSQVSRRVNIIMGASNLDSLQYLNFYIGTDNSGTLITPAAITAGTATLLNETFAAGDAGSGTVNLYWEWPFESDEAQDIADTANGINAITNGEVTITFSAVQLDN